MNRELQNAGTKIRSGVYFLCYLSDNEGCRTQSSFTNPHYDVFFAFGPKHGADLIGSLWGGAWRHPFGNEKEPGGTLPHPGSWRTS